jgi:hypothetical protein
VKARSIIAILACLLSGVLLPLANVSFSTFVFISPALFALLGLAFAIMAVLNKKENRKMAKLALVINLCNLLGYLLFILYMGFLWDL